MRSLEDHLSPQELASLPESPETLASAGPDQQQLSQHLQKCEDCATLAHTHWSLRSLRVNTASASDEPCPEQDAWLEFAAGLRPEQSSALLSHAAGCRSCADALQEAMQLMQPDQLDTAEPLEGLATATPLWQRRVAAQMMSAAGKPEAAPTDVPNLKPHPRRTFLEWLRLKPAWITLPLTATIFCAAVLTGVMLWRTAHPSDAKLLALAYNKQRTLELRIPGGNPVAMASITRGEAVGPNHGLAEPSELLKLRLRAQQHLDQTPNSPYWHQIIGEINLLQQDGIAARRNFEIAQTVNDKLPNLQTDLAAAWFEIGEQSQTAEDYAEAAEIYSKQISSESAKKQSTDLSLLYYNRALCWERLSITENALADLHAALQLEHSKPWQQAIQAEIKRLSSRSATASTDRYETTLGEVIEKLLPQWNSSSQIRAKIEQTAQLGLRHQDPWLADWVTSKHTSIEIDADRHLASAVAASHSGDPGPSLAEAEKVAALYTQSHPNPDLVRAELAELHAFQRLGRAADCLQTAKVLEGNPHVITDAVIQAQVLLERGDCVGRSGDLTKAKTDYIQAGLVSLAADLPLTHINAIAAQAEALQTMGRTSSAWQLEVSGMQTCVQIGCPLRQQYSLLYNMVQSAQILGQSHVAVELMHTAEKLAGASGSVNLHAFAAEILGTFAGRTGDYKESDTAFAQAYALAQTSHPPALYRAVWQTDQAEISSRRGDSTSALRLLNESGATIRSSDYIPGRINFFEQKAVAEMALGRRSDALADARLSVAEAERSLSSLHSSFERQEWARENTDVYAALISVYLRSGDNTSALRAWERFRSAPYTNESLVNGGNETQPVTAHALVIARVGEQYIGWLVNAGTLEVLRTATLGDRAHIHQSAITFYHLCADQESNLTDVHNLGKDLDTNLIEPLTERTMGSAHLWIDLDPSLSMLPLQALTTAAGDWLGDVAQLTILPPWWSLDPASALTESSISSSAHMVIFNGFADAPTKDSEAAALMQLFPHVTSLDGTAITPATALKAMSSAELFHFAGHAESSSGAKLLLSRTVDSGFSLTPEALSTIRLSGCRLAVLAACNTVAANPDRIEDVRTIRNALLLDGAHAVIASYWDVDDHSTQSLMTTFYKQLVSGLHPSRALQIAQQSIRSTAGWQHPYFWASFQTFTR